jgi:hypothetical protein
MGRRLTKTLSEWERDIINEIFALYWSWQERGVVSPYLIACVPSEMGTFLWIKAERAGCSILRRREPLSNNFSLGSFGGVPESGVTRYQVRWDLIGTSDGTLCRFRASLCSKAPAIAA